MTMYAIPISDLWLLYAPAQSIAAVVNYPVLEKLRNGSFEKEPDDFNILRDLQASEAKFLPAPRQGPLDPGFLGIISTRSCNIDCIYCGFGSHRSGKLKMSPGTAVSSINWMVDNLLELGKDTLNIHFFGGEPFAAWDIIELVVHYSRLIAAKKGLLPHFEVSTNGVFDERKALFIGDYFDAVVLSFDGLPEFQNRNRPINSSSGSFEAVSQTARRLNQFPVEMCFRTCVTQESVSHLQEITHWFCTHFEPDAVSFETLQPNSRSISTGIHPPDPYEFAVHFVHSRGILEKYGIKAVYAADVSAEPVLSFCPVGKDNIIISPDGQINTCYLLEEEWQNRGMDLKIGQVQNNGSLHFDSQAIQQIRQLVTEKPGCEKCFCKWWCAGGCHVNHSYPGNSYTNSNFCIQTRIITACSLLKELNQEALLEQLITSKTLMESLALQQSDCLEDIKKNE
jgi:uncharacterized protein